MAEKTRKADAVPETVQPAVQEVRDSVPKAKPDNSAVAVTVYLLYKANIIARNHVKILLKAIKDMPEELDVLDYLTKEAGRG